MSPVDVLGLFGLLAGAAAVLATLFVKGRSKVEATNWQTVATSATARAAEAEIRASIVEAENEKLRVRVEHLEQQVKVLVDTITAKDSIEALARDVEARFEALTNIVIDAMKPRRQP